jgi:hypothetical protein
MYTTLWWKDARQFWPIWVFLTLTAAVVQGLLLYYGGQDARNGALGISALICASLYAFATGAAAFAGEREMGTLRLLDILPADRRVVWGAKVSFALVTTLALTLILLAMAALYTDRWDLYRVVSLWEALSFAMIVLVALGWGLFWSAILSSALTAAVMAILCTAASLGLVMSRLDNVILHHVDLSVFVLWQFGLFLATLIASVAIFARSMSWKRVQIEFRSPIVINLADPAGPRRVQLQVQSPVTTIPIAQPAVGLRGAVVSNHPPQHSWVAEARAMAWQTMKEGRKTWGLLTAIWLIAPGLIFLWLGYSPNFEGLSLTGLGISLVAGASVFGLENRSRTQRFLTHHGARPGLVWLSKLAVWSVALCLIGVVGLAVSWGPLAFMDKTNINHIYAISIENWISGISIVLLYFGIALVCGMAIRRGITALLVALVAGLALTVPLGALVVVNMLPAPGLLVIPAGLLAVSWAWSADWLFDRPAPGRWVRLSLLLTGMFTLALCSYAGYRAWSIRDVGPITPPSAWIEAKTAPFRADQNAADLYREVGHRLIGPFRDSPEFLDRNRELLDLLRRATVQPDCRFLDAEKLTVLDQLDMPPLGQLSGLLALDARERQNRGDLTGTWDDIMALFRMAHHAARGSGFVMAFPSALSIERNALGHALEWAVARGQTPERLHAALAAYRELPSVSPTVDMLRAEANLVEKTLDLPTSRLRDWLLESGSLRPRVQGTGITALTTALFDLATMPWERTRARRVNRLIANAALQDAIREPWQRSHLADAEIEYAQTTSRNAMMLIRNLSGYVTSFDQNEVGKRALVQVLALRAWQLQHGGQFPKSLDVLVPIELPRLPNDPYSGRQFGYIPSHGQEVPALRLALTPSLGQEHRPIAGSWLLYSVGANFEDDSGITFKSRTTPQLLDIVFEIPPVHGADGIGKGLDMAKDRPTPGGSATAAKPGP